MTSCRAMLASVAAAATSSVLALDARAAAPEATTIGEVVVTAQKRSQQLSEVPASVTALTAEMRERTGIVSTQDQMNFTPGVVYSATADRVAIRGVGRQTNQIGTDPGVAVYQDGFYLPGLAGLGASTLGTDRIEVLRGPQGTLYGRNSIGGAINVVSRRPSSQMQGEVRLGVNDYRGFTEELRLSGPLSASLRGSVQLLKVDQEDGYFRNVAGGTDEGGVTDAFGSDVQLAWSPTDRIEGWLRWSYNRFRNHDRNDNVVSPYDTRWSLGIAPTPTYGLAPASSPGFSDPRSFAANRPSTQDLRDNHTAISEWTYRGEAFEAKYIGGYTRYTLRNTGDGDLSARVGFSHPVDFNFQLHHLGSPFAPAGADFDSDLTAPGVQTVGLPVLGDDEFGTDERKRAFSHEINLSSQGDGPLQWLAGAYYYQEQLQQGFHIAFPGQAEYLTPYRADMAPMVVCLANCALVPFAGLGSLGAAPNTPANPAYDAYRNAASLKTRSWAVFGQVDYDITETLHATLGLRYSHDRKRGHEEQRIVAFLPYGVPAAFDADGPGPAPALPIPIVISRAYDVSVLSSCPLTLDCGATPGDPFAAGPAKRDVADSWSATSGTAGLQWTPSVGTLVYASYGRGFKSGGFNLGVFAVAPVEEETLDAFEIGWKQRFGATLQVNAAVFDYRYRGMQAPNQFVPTAGVSLPTLVNLRSARSRGLELEAEWRPLERLTVLANYSYLDAEITSACCLIDAANPYGALYSPNVVGVDPGGNALQRLDGNQTPFSPRRKLALNVAYTIPVGAGSLSLSATHNMRSSAYYTIFNTPDYRMRGFQTTNIRAVWRDGEDRFAVLGTISNLFDEEAVQSYTTSSPQQGRQTTIGLQPPRIYRLELQYRF